MERVTVDQAKAMMRDNMQEMRKAYTQMRDIAQKRIKRMGETEFSQTKTYKNNREGFKKLKDIDPRDFAKAFSELSKFVTAKGSRVTGQRSIQAKTTATLNRAIGSAGVTKQNYWRVMKILEESRLRKVKYDSDKIVSLAETTLPLNEDQFDVVLDNLEKLIPNSAEVGGSLTAYMKEHDIQNFQRIDIDDFIEEIGW